MDYTIDTGITLTFNELVDAIELMNDAERLDTKKHLISLGYELKTLPMSLFFNYTTRKWLI